MTCPNPSHPLHAPLSVLGVHATYERLKAAMERVRCVEYVLLMGDGEGATVSTSYTFSVGRASFLAAQACADPSLKTLPPQVSRPSHTTFKHEGPSASTTRPNVQHSSHLTAVSLYSSDHRVRR